jgi:cytochrome c-type biogenesis protein CcmE
MKTRHKRFTLILLGLALLGLAAYFVLSTFERNLVFFFTPTQIFQDKVPQNRSFRVGGLVEANSLQHSRDGFSVSFYVTDTVHRVQVTYRGLLPDLFKEGKGVVAQGRLDQNRVFIAQEVLAKHDENYMPPDAAYAIKNSKNLSYYPQPVTTAK